MSYISENPNIKSTTMIYCAKRVEETIRDSYSVRNSVKEVRNGNLSRKKYNYTRLVNGTATTSSVYRKDQYLIDSGRLLLDFDYKDSTSNKFQNVYTILKPHIQEWGIIHMEESARGGAHITVQKTQGLTNSQIVRLFELRTGLKADYTGLNLSKACYLVPNNMVHYVNDDLYYTQAPIPLLPLSEDDKLLLEEDAREQELQHQEQIQARLATAQIYTPTGDEATEIERIVTLLDQSGVSLDDYNQWIVLGLVIAYIMGESGRQHYHTLSRNSYKYDSHQCDKTYDNLITSARGEVTLGTLIWYAREEGVVV